MQKRKKKNIDRLKIHTEFAGISNGCCIANTKDVKTILSMLEEKYKEIDKLKKHNDDLLRKLRNRVKEVKKLQKYSLYKKEFSRLNKQLQNKDKIIDLMSEEISKNILNTCPLEDYNYDLDCENKCNDNYKECWKQYFENKAKELINR